MTEYERGFIDGIKSKVSAELTPTLINVSKTMLEMLKPVISTALENALNDNNAITDTDVQPVNQWISVDEKLPKTGESVLVCVAINKNLKGFGECKPEMRIGWLDDGDKWALQFSNMDYSEVLCWMPLPEPPKDGDAEWLMNT